VAARRWPSRLGVRPFCALVLLQATAAAAVASTYPPTQYRLPLTASRMIRFTTHEGTWLSLDVSPGGQQIVFDLMGDLYLLPIAGGVAKRITSGPAIDTQPRFSPDGRRIVFLSDRSGTYNVWTCEVTGDALHQVTHSAPTRRYLREFIQPQWTPDGRAILVTHALDEGDGRFDLAALDASGQPVPTLKVAQQPSSRSEASGPFASSYTASASFVADGSSLYATQYLGSKGSSQHPEGSDFQIVRIDPATGKRDVVTSEVGGAVQPLASPDGRYLVYATRYPTGNGPSTGLRLMDLNTGRVSWLAEKIEPSLQGSFVHWPFGLLPNAAFTADSRSIVISHDGKLWRISIPSGATEEIQFIALVEQALRPLIRFPAKPSNPQFTARIVRDARYSPDGGQLAFVALDRVWVMQLPNGKPRPLIADSSASQYSPAWSPDGRFLAYLTWSDHGGHAYRVRVRDIARHAVEPERLTARADFYDKLVYAPDGKTLAAVRAPWRTMLDRPDVSGRDTKALDLIELPASGGATPTSLFTTRVRDGGYGWPQFTQRDSTRIYFFANGTLWSVRRDGSAQEAKIRTSGYAWPPANVDLLLAPDGQQALLEQMSTVSLIRLPSADQPQIVPLGLKDPDDPRMIEWVSPIGGEFPVWSTDGNSFSYSLGHTLFTQQMPRSTATVVKPELHRPERLDIVVRATRDKPAGLTLFEGGRIITMRGGEVIENGDILVRDDRILAVGAHGTLKVPRGAKRIDFSKMTALPGYVLTHEHIEAPWGVHVARVWQYLLALSYGVTTLNDPQSQSSADRFTYADRIEAGTLLGPRVVSTGTAIEYQPLNTPQEADELVRRYSQFYDSHMLKERGVGGRERRQWVAEAAFREKLTLVGHWQDGLISQVLDGYSGIEHSSFVPWYDDMLHLLASSGTVYTPTTLVSSNGPRPLGYFAQQTDFSRETKLWRFAPREWLEKHLLLPQLDAVYGLALKQGYAFELEAAQAAKLVRAGGRVGVSTDGLLQGLGAHWEMWALALGGMPPGDVLRSATLTGAQAIGMDAELGSLESGKLADLQFLDANPLADIHNTNTVRWVMKNGRLYEAETLNETAPGTKLLVQGADDSPWWWEELPPDGRISASNR
jgi:Tol biopolymer transport system component